MTALLSWLKIVFSNLVFFMKCRAGFLLLEPVTIHGTVVMVEVAEDGDVCFGVIPDSPALLTYRTSGAVHVCEAVLCEIVPADRARLAGQIVMLKPGARVRVSGRRAWDGCHHGRGLLFDVLMVLLRAAPVLDGWIEIHPVTELEVLL